MFSARKICAVRALLLSLMAALAGGLFAGCSQGGSSTAESIPTAVEAEPVLEQPIETRTNFYYYLDGERTVLTPSLEWISARFTATEADAREAGLIPYAGRLGALNEMREIPAPTLTLLPLREGMNVQDFLDLMQDMRADDQHFIFANPLFEMDDVWMTFTDQFIAGFSTDLSRAEIDAINAQYGVVVVDVILGQENVFLLLAVPGSGLDALTAANLYQESGVAIHAAPNFIRITK